MSPTYRLLIVKESNTASNKRIFGYESPMDVKILNTIPWAQDTGATVIAELKLIILINHLINYQVFNIRGNILWSVLSFNTNVANNNHNLSLID